MTSDIAIVREFIKTHSPWIPIRDRRSLPSYSGVYVIKSGNCISQVGEASNIQARISSLRLLTAHRVSAQVLCAAKCTGKEPEAYCQEITGIRKRRSDEEKRLKDLFGGQKKIPAPFSKYERCRKGFALEQELLKQASQWQAGQIGAVFEIGEFLGILFRPRFDNLWERVGKPPGWEGFSRPNRTVR